MFPVGLVLPGLKIGSKSRTLPFVRIDLKDQEFNRAFCPFLLEDCKFYLGAAAMKASGHARKLYLNT